MLLFGPSLCVFGYILLRLVWHLPCPLWLKGVAGAVLLAVCGKYIIYEQFGGNFFAPALPAPFLLVMEAAYAAVVILFFLLLVRDALLLCSALVRLAGLPLRLPLDHAGVSMVLTLAALTMGAYGTAQAVNVPEVRTVEIALPRLPAALDGFSLIQLSDIHIGPLLKGDWLKQVVARTNKEQADLIVITGDFIDGLPDALYKDIAPLGELKAKYGVFGITGNHEYYFNAPAWLSVFHKLGITMLHNEHHVLMHNGVPLVLAGVPDKRGSALGGQNPDVQQALADAPDAVRILLEHQPAGATSNSGMDIQLSGHTHGGLLFFLQPLMAFFNNGFVNGLYPLGNDRYLYVHPGTGLWNGFSCRLGVPSEITRIILRSTS